MCRGTTSRAVRSRPELLRRAPAGRPPPGVPRRPEAFVSRRSSSLLSVVRRDESWRCWRFEGRVWQYADHCCCCSATMGPGRNLRRAVFGVAAAAPIRAGEPGDRVDTGGPVSGVHRDSDVYRFYAEIVCILQVKWAPLAKNEADRASSWAVAGFPFVRALRRRREGP